MVVLLDEEPVDTVSEGHHVKHREGPVICMTLV